MTHILNQVEQSLYDFRPRTHREFVVLQIAHRFDDRGRLARYLNVSRQHPKKVLLEAARLALIKSNGDLKTGSEAFFQLLEQFAREEAA